ncbi:hypothetical protein BH09GEM1_BH09GEM1_11200 [soil metagenome]
MEGAFFADDMHTLLLVDGTNVVMRCASVPAFTPVEAIAAAVRIVERAVDTIGASHVIIAFDSAEESIRKQTYPAYKANRTSDTTPWVAGATAAYAAAGFYWTACAGFEADDVIATIAARAQGRQPIAVLSSDSDLLALSSAHVTVWRFEKDVRGGIAPWSVERVCEKYGIPTPQHLTLYKALVGETGDNVPGVPKIGPVRARKLIAEFGTLDMMKRLGVLNEHAAWAEQAATLLSLYDFAPVPPIDPARIRVARPLASR